MTERVAAWSGRDGEGNQVAGRLTITIKPRPTVLSGQVQLPDGLVVPAGEQVVFDPTTDTVVEAAANVVVEGTLVMRPDPGVTHVLRFVGVDESAYVGGGTQVLDSDVGLWVVAAGRWEAAGAAKTPWLRLTTGLAKGARAFELPVAPAGWRPGDELLIAPTEPVTVANHFQHDELLTVESVDGRTVNLSQPLAYDHPAFTRPDTGQVLGPEVGNLTRSMRIEGTPQGRAHVMVMHPHAGVADLSHVELRHLGPRQPSASGATYKQGTVTYPVLDGVLGRYPFHIHHGGDGTRGAVHTGLVARDCGNHAFVPHASHGVTLAGCIAHNITDEAFWWDPPPVTDDASTVNDSLDVVLDGCWASRVAVSPGAAPYRLASFSLGRGNRSATTPTGTCIGCVATGNQGQKDSAGFAWPEFAQAVWRFEDCAAHNNAAHGVFVWQNTDKPHLIERLACYRNGRAGNSEPGDGIRHGAYRNAYRYRGCLSVENAGWGFGKAAASGSTPGGARQEVDGWFDTMRITRHNLPASREGLVSGRLGRLVVEEASSTQRPDLVLFDHVGLSRDAVQIYSVCPGTILRFVEANDSWEIRG